METVLLYIAAVCFGLSFLIVFFALVYSLLFKRNQKPEQKEKTASEITHIYLNSALIRFKISGLERQTKWLNEQKEKRSSESKVSS